jgi:hypothetical protein
MKTIKSLKDITTLEVGDKVVFGNLEYEVIQGDCYKRYFLVLSSRENDKIFKVLNIDKEDFIDKLGIKTASGRFPETYSLEALTAVVGALFKEYEKQQNELPKTWEEFCEKNPVKIGEYFIDASSKIFITRCAGHTRNASIDKNNCVSEQDAEAFLALMQLRQLRKAYVKDWEPDWTSDADPKYCVYFYGDHIKIGKWGFTSQVLSFPTDELANQFLTNFRNLLEIAKPLL